MKSMTQSAQVVLTGYDKPKIKASIKMIKRFSEKIDLKIIEDSVEIKAKSKLWGCENNNVEQEILFLSGTMDDLQKILHVEIKDGIYLQLLLK